MDAHIYANKWRVHIRNCQSCLCKNAFSSGSVMFSQYLTADGNITHCALQTTFNIETIIYHWPEMYCTLSDSFSQICTKNKNRQGCHCFNSMDLPEVSHSQTFSYFWVKMSNWRWLVHVAHNCITDTQEIFLLGKWAFACFFKNNVSKVHLKKNVFSRQCCKPV